MLFARVLRRFARFFTSCALSVLFCVWRDGLRFFAVQDFDVVVVKPRAGVLAGVSCDVGLQSPHAIFSVSIHAGAFLMASANVSSV
jgi:hypothetical protein